MPRLQILAISIKGEIMNNTYINIIAVTVISLSLSGCSGLGFFGDKGEEKQLLPDSGETTADLIKNGISRNNKSFYFAEGKADYVGTPLVANYAPNSQYSNEHINELKRDFRQVPNPQIIGYTYPHINNNEMPVPGYFTTFNLYKTNHYALAEEGYNVR